MKTSSRLDCLREIAPSPFELKLQWNGLAFKRRKLTSVVFAVSVVLAATSGPMLLAELYRADAFSVLDSLSDQVLASDRYLGRTRIVLLSSKILHYDFAPDQSAVLAPRDPVIRSLEALIRAKALGRDFASVFPTEIFWIQPLDHVRAITQALNGIGPEGAGKEGQLKERLAQIDEQFQLLETATVQYAARHQLETESARDPAAPYKVEIRVEPPRARVRFMPLLCYIRARKFNTALDDQWIDLQTGTQHLIGRYRYVAEWPAELSGPVEGTFEIREDSVITFTPAKH
jgi:hypothetical protein